MALLSGLGGGNFASSMSNISFFFPKKVQGYSLGMNAGLGNFGVTTMQILIPLVMTVGMFGGTSMTLKSTSGTLIGKIPAGTETFLHNSGFIWVAILVPIVLAAWFGMNNIKASHVSPNLKSPLPAFGKNYRHARHRFYHCDIWFMVDVASQCWRSRHGAFQMGCSSHCDYSYRHCSAYDPRFHRAKPQTSIQNI